MYIGESSGVRQRSGTGKYRPPDGPTELLTVHAHAHTTRSRENIHSMRSFLRAEQLNMVPLWLAMAPPSKERGRCEGGHSITAADLCPRVYTFQYNRMVQCRIGNCATSDVVERECPATDVQFALFFGHCQLERRG